MAMLSTVVSAANEMGKIRLEAWKMAKLDKHLVNYCLKACRQKETPNARKK